MPKVEYDISKVLEEMKNNNTEELQQRIADLEAAIAAILGGVAQ